MVPESALDPPGAVPAAARGIRAARVAPGGVAEGREHHQYLPLRLRDRLYGRRFPRRAQVEIESAHQLFSPMEAASMAGRSSGLSSPFFPPRVPPPRGLALAAAPAPWGRRSLGFACGGSARRTRRGFGRAHETR